MGGGFGTGFLKGALFFFIGAAAVSLVAPLDPTDPGNKTQVDLSTPAGSGFNAERADTNPVLPDTDQSVVTEEITKPELAPESPAVPVADTTSAEQPDAQGGVEMPEVSADEDELAMVAPPEDDAPDATPPALGVPMPEIENPVTDIPVNRLPVIEPPTTEVEAPTAPVAEDTPTEGSTSEAETDSPEVIRITETAPEAGKAFMRNRVAFDNSEARPLMSIILVDAGEEGLDMEVLLTFTFPVTFALDPADSSTTARAKKLAQGGFEILALAPQADGKLEVAENPADINAALSGYFSKIPEAVGLIDATAAEIQKSAPLSDQVIEALASSGHGFLTYDIGLNSTDQKARRAGLPAGTVFRVLDSERESGTVIKRYLNRAVIEAGQNGHVIVLGHTYPETVTALFSWALSAKSATVALAPVSAAMLSR